MYRIYVTFECPNCGCEHGSYFLGKYEKEKAFSVIMDLLGFQQVKIVVVRRDEGVRSREVEYESD